MTAGYCWDDCDCGCQVSARKGGCEEKIVRPDDVDNLVRAVAREKAKLCPQCNSAYLAVVPVPTQPLHDIPTHCTTCGVKKVWAHLPLCWCGASIHPRDKFCETHGHEVCRCEDKAACPGWHDYSALFVNADNKRGFYPKF